MSRSARASCVRYLIPTYPLLPPRGNGGISSLDIHYCAYAHVHNRQVFQKLRNQEIDISDLQRNESNTL